MGDDSINKHDLVTNLHRKNLFVLKDIQIDSSLNYWANSLELGLIGRFVEEWDRYISPLNHGNITRFYSDNKLVWSFNPRDGKVTTKLAYHSIISIHSSYVSHWW